MQVVGGRGVISDGDGTGGGSSDRSSSRSLHSMMPRLATPYSCGGRAIYQRTSSRKHEHQVLSQGFVYETFVYALMALE